MSRKTVAFGGGIVLVLALIVGAARPLPVVTVRLPRLDNRLIHVKKVNIGDKVVLAYRHSVELTAVEGIFRVAEGLRITAAQTKMASSGTGMPDTAPERTTRQNGWLVVDEQEKEIPSIRFFIVPVNQTRLSIADTAVDIDSLSPGSLIEIRAEKFCAFDLWLFAVFRG